MSFAVPFLPNFKAESNPLLLQLIAVAFIQHHNLTSLCTLSYGQHVNCTYAVPNKSADAMLLVEVAHHFARKWYYSLHGSSFQGLRGDTF